MLLDEAALLRACGTRVVVIEPDAGDLKVMGGVVEADVLDERRCPAVVRRVHASTVERARRGAFPGLELLPQPARVAA
jgi:hypothetical protein